MGRIENKVAIVTGGASGMGAGTVKRFIEEGAKVIIADVQEARGRAFAKSLGANAHFMYCDVRSEDNIEEVVQTAVKRWGRLDCMFNNAGRGGNHTDIDKITVEEWEEFHAVLLRGVFLGIKHAARVMKKQRSGSIINTSSVAGMRACYGPHPYSSAKAAVIHLTKATAMELAKDFVRVNCIAPGGIATLIFGTSAGLSVEETEQLLPNVSAAMAQMQPIPRTGMPADIAAAALWFASDESSFVTGQTMVVDGGLIAGQSWEKVIDLWNQFRDSLGVGSQGR